MAAVQSFLSGLNAMQIFFLLIAIGSLAGIVIEVATKSLKSDLMLLASALMCASVYLALIYKP